MVVTTIAAIVGIAVGIAGMFFGVKAISTSNAIRRTELIRHVYDAFMEEKLFRFYARVRNRETIDWQHEDDERLLNKSLTLFDEVDYLLRQGLLHWIAKWWSSEAWEYLAGEIQYFSANESVWDYIVTRIREGLDRGFPRDIIPFTGFRELLHSIPTKYRARPFPCVPERHKAFFDNLDSFQS